MRRVDYAVEAPGSEKTEMSGDDDGLGEQRRKARFGESDSRRRIAGKLPDQ
jgi:hypothetical protein